MNVFFGGGGGGCLLFEAGISFFSSHSAKLGLHITHTEHTDVQARFHEFHKCDRM